MDEREPLLSSSRSGGRQDEAEETRLPFCNAFRNEFSSRKLLLAHPRDDVFYSCQWDWAPAIFIVYRLVIAAYAAVILVLSIIHFDHKKWTYSWPVFLTNWSFTVLTAHLLLAAAISLYYNTDRGRCCHRASLRTSVHGFCPDSDLDPSVSIIPPSPNPWYIKLDWVLFNVSSTSAVVVTIVYFAALYPQLFPDGGLSLSDGTLHLSNTIIIILEYFLCAIPLHLLHAVYALIYGLIYIGFTIVYWAVDHTHVIYPNVLDWNKPGVTLAVVILLAVVGLPLLQFLFFCCYRLRLYAYDRVYASATQNNNSATGPGSHKC